jgi:hypothetical protein
MRHMTKTTLAALASLALLPAAVSAHTVKAPHGGTVITTTYYSDGTFHGAVDVSSGTCNERGVETGVVGSFHWNVTLRTTGILCLGDAASNSNEARHLFADGWTFRIWHWNKSSDSYDRTCDRCQVGKEGATGNVSAIATHFQHDLSGTKDTSWYSGYTLKGEVVDRTETLGLFD